MRAKLASETDRCVMCGLCLPHCPTYRNTLSENESPRGRIALMKAVLSGELAPTPALLAHVNRCLLCHACEDMCPSNVRYNRLVDGFRELQFGKHPRERATRILNYLVTHRGSLDRIGGLLRIYQRSGLQRILRAGGILGITGLSDLDRLLPPFSRSAPLHTYYPPAVESRGMLALFTGCINTIVEPDTLHAAIRLLNRIGYGVHVPAGQGCCGALHLHEGNREQARELAASNLKAFDINSCTAVLTTSSGCGAMLYGYTGLLEGTSGQGQAKQFSRCVRDISSFLSESGSMDELRFRPLEKTVLVHEPCTLIHALHQHGGARDLLARIPGIDLRMLPVNGSCCGAAGSYLLTQPAMAAQLRDSVLADAMEHGPDIIVTSNVGCAMHLGAGLRSADSDIEVIHPVVLLARQLESRGDPRS